MARWTESYEEIEERGTGFWGRRIKEDAKRDRRMRRSSMSSAWSRRSRAKDPDKVVLDLMRIREAVKGIVRTHGAPPRTQIDIADTSSLGHGLAGFHGLDAARREKVTILSDGHFTGPYIKLSRAVYDGCDPDEVLDVYCGIGLHEVSHLMHTRLFYKDMFKGLTSFRRYVWNVLEDDRIEDLVCEESPGYEGYIGALRRVLFEKKEFGQAVEKFDDLPDNEKFHVIFFSLVRCPHRVTDAMREFTTVDGINVFNELNLILHKCSTEVQVKLLMEKVEALYRRIYSKYDEEVATEKKQLEDMEKALEELKKMMAEGGAPGEGGEGGDSGESGEDGESSDGKSGKGTLTIVVGGSGGGRPMTEEELTRAIKDAKVKVERRDKVKESTGEDAAAERKASETKEAEKKLASDGEASSAKSAAEKAVGKSAHKAESLEKMEKESREATDTRDGRFSVMDILRMLDRVFGGVAESVVHGDLETKKEEMDGDRVYLDEHWSHRDVERETVVAHPRPTGDNAERYKRFAEEVKGHVAAMRNNFRFRLGTRVHKETELTEGRLHRRMLAKAPLTDRLFTRSYTKTDKGIAICLLLDESGSMGGVDYGGAARDAFKIAVLIAEALRGVPGVELEVYSYASCGAGDKDCFVKYLYGKNNPKFESIGGYNYGCQNYDHMAIKTAGKLFKKNTKNENRVMLILSDGAPAGYAYGGASAKALTKQAVDALEKDHIMVTQIAIQRFDSESMFKHVIRFLDIPKLVQDMRNFVTQIIKRAT